MCWIAFKALAWKKLVLFNITKKESPKQSLPKVTSETSESETVITLEIYQYSKAYICVGVSF